MTIRRRDGGTTPRRTKTVQELEGWTKNLDERWREFMTELTKVLKVKKSERMTQAFMAANVTVDLERILGNARHRLREMKANGEFEA